MTVSIEIIVSATVVTELFDTPVEIVVEDIVKMPEKF